MTANKQLNPLVLKSKPKPIKKVEITQENLDQNSTKNVEADKVSEPKVG